MPDYFCWPLWNMDSEKGIPYNIDPKTLPISDGLKMELQSWADIFDAILDLNDPGNGGGFRNEQDYYYFCDQGWDLLEKLRRELPEITFWYRDGRVSELLQNKPDF